MIIDSSNIELIRHLLGAGLNIKVGPFSYLINSSFESIAHNISRLYTGLVFKDDENLNSFADFHISIQPPNLIRSLIRKQAQFFLDDQATFDAFPLVHATAMLEWCMNWCVSTRIHTYLIVHAAVIERNGLAAVLPAPPGSGKSTLCATLVQEGWRLLSDELTLIDLKTYQVVPMPRPIGLKNQSIDIIKQRYPQSVLGMVSVDTIKGSVCHLKPPNSSVSMQHVTCPVGWIIFPQFDAHAKTELTDRTKGTAFIEIASNAFNYSMLGTTGFDVLKNVVDRALCFDFRYSILDEAIEVFANLPIAHEV